MKLPRDVGGYCYGEEITTQNIGRLLKSKVKIDVMNTHSIPQHGGDPASCLLEHAVSAELVRAPGQAHPFLTENTYDQICVTF